MSLFEVPRQPVPINPATLLGDKLDDEFAVWLTENQAVVSAFIRFTREKARRGEKVGAKAVAERLRWESGLGHLNNNMVSRLARYVMATEPDLADYFATRELRAA